MASEAPVIRLVNALIAQAIEKRASDIHIEPFEKEFHVRYRVDGVLFNQEAPPRELKEAIVSRLKLMAKLNIAERRLPETAVSKSASWAARWISRIDAANAIRRKRGDAAARPSAGNLYDLRRLGFDNHISAALNSPRSFRTVSFW